MLYIAYLDEFGHIGPFVGRNDPRYNTSPVFGLGGLVLPSNCVRPFATWFFQLKTRLLTFEIQRDGIHPAKWEKKGASLYTTRNVTTYQELRHATNRLLNRIIRVGGFWFYVGIEKDRTPERSNSKALYRAVLMESIKRLNDCFGVRGDEFLIVLDQQDGEDLRAEIVASSGRTMFGTESRRHLIEPPIQAESHLYQTLQCADWFCGLVGRYAAHDCRPQEYADFSWADTYFGDRIRRACVASSVRKVVPVAPAAVIVL